MHWKKAFWITVIILVGSNLFWLIQLMDAGISLTYLEASHDSANQEVSSLRKLVQELSSTTGENDFFDLCHRLHTEEEVFRKKLETENHSGIACGGTWLLFEQGKLIDIGDVDIN